MSAAPTLTDYLTSWLDEVVRPNLRPATFAYRPEPGPTAPQEPAVEHHPGPQVPGLGRADEDPLYAAYVLVLVNALSKGEVLGLTWTGVHLDRAELTATWQLQRVGTELIHKAKDAGGILPLPDISVAALKLRHDWQDAARDLAGDRWQPTDLVFTTRWGTPARILCHAKLTPAAPQPEA